MPSKFSDQLKQAIIYIKAGEMEIAKEIIMEIIQKDPEYEKAWIWLVETVPDKREKADILKTRIEQFPNSSPLAHRVLQKIAMEILDDYSGENESPSVLPSPQKTNEEEPEEEEITVNDIESEEPVEEDNNEFEDIESLFEEPAEDEEEFSSADRFEALFQDETEEKNIPDDNLDLDLSDDVEDYDELLEQDLEQFLQDDLNQGYFKETIEKKPDQNEEIEIEEDETDPLDLDSWLEMDEDDVNEEDDLSEVLSQYIDAQEEPSQTPDSGEVNPFILNSKESIQLLGEDITETSKSDEGDDNTGQSSNAFSAEGLDELGVNQHGSRPEFLSDDLFFPDTDQVPGSPVSADDLLLTIEDKSDTKTMAEGGIKKSSGKIKSKTKKKKEGGKEKNNRQTFIFGCSIIAVIILLAMIGLGILFFKNWQSNPQEPTLIILPSTNPTEEYILEAPWLEEEAESSTPTPEE